MQINKRMKVFKESKFSWLNILSIIYVIMACYEIIELVSGMPAPQFRDESS
jgi:hypothetical protein